MPNFYVRIFQTPQVKASYRFYRIDYCAAPVTSSYSTIHNSLAIDRLSYWRWHCIISFIDHAIQINVGQKDKANQWKVTVLEEFLHIVLLYHCIKESLSEL